MRSSLTANVLLGLLAAGAATIFACSSSDGGGGGTSFPTGTAGAASSTAGAPGAAGSVGTAGAASAGAPSGAAGASSATAGAGGSTGTAGAGGSTGTAGAGGSTGTAGAGTAGGAGGGAATGITAVVKTTGCGMIPPAAFQIGQTSGVQHISTTGTKPADCADSSCGAWTYTRDYYVTLPSGYDNNKAYPIVFEGPGCGGNGTDVYPLKGPDYSKDAQNANNTVIRVGLTPPPNDIGHATNPNQGCFDDKEGDSSVDWTFYENLYDKLAGQLCFDKNRVFASGNSSGAWFSNELGCKYAGDATRPVRGIMPNTGGLPTDAKYVPTCTNKPMAGIWMGETMDPENPFAGNVVAINRAILVNKCTGGNWPDTPTTDYPVIGKSMVCKNITGCPTQYPLVVCLLPGNAHQSHDDTANPAFVKFLQYFSTGALITQ